MSGFKYEISVSENIIRVILEGELSDEFTAQVDLKNKIDSNIDKEIMNCIVDLSKAKYMSSNGISWFIVLLTKLRNRGGELVLLNPSEHIKKLLLITKLNGIFDVFDNETEAIDFFKK